MDKRKNKFLEEAVNHLRTAQQAMYRPEEDVVTYVVCKNSQEAIVDYLKAYLLHKGFETHDHETMEGLLKRCRAMEPKFKQIDLSVIDCKAQEIDDSYCLSTKKVANCQNVADTLDTLMRNLKLL